MDINTHASKQTEGWGFGLSTAGTAALLRKLADDIDAKRVVVTDVRNIQRAHADDFLLQSLIIRFSEQVEGGYKHIPSIVPSVARIVPSLGIGEIPLCPKPETPLRDAST